MKVRISVTKEKDLQPAETDCILTDDAGNPIALLGNSTNEMNETERIRALYPGQPEEEDTSDETMPAASDFSGPGSSDKVLSDEGTAEAPDTNREEEEENIVEIPVFITAVKYIFKRYRLMMFSYMNQLLRQGRLSRITGLRFRNKVLNRDSLQFGFMSFRKIDRTNFYVDVTVNLHLDTDRGKKDWRGTLVLWGSFDGPELVCTAEELTSGTSRKEEGLVPLSPFLVPYLRNSEVDRIAEKILKKYLPEAIDDPHLRNASRLAERMGLTVHYLPLYDHVGIPSVLMWEAGELPVMDKWRVGQKEPDIVTVPKNSIIVNTNEIRDEYAYFPIYHECIHHELHYMAYRLQKLASNDKKGIKYQKVKIGQGKPVVNPLHFMEKQANRGAYGLMMPETVTRKMIREEYSRAEDCRHEGEKYQVAGKNMAFKLILPDFRIRARMVQLGYLQAKGALNYVQKQPIKPFAFDPDAWRDNQHTFVIDPASAEHLMRTNEDFRKLICSKRYIYADGHIVRNDPRYVRDQDGSLLLTPWANEHVDECCLRFIRKYMPTSIGRFGYGRIYYDADYIRQTLFYLEDIMETDGIDEIDAKYRYKKRFPDTFQKAVIMLMRKKKVSQEKMAEQLNTSVRTMMRWLEEPWKYGGVDFVTALALALQLPDWITAMLFKRAHLQLDEDDRRHQAIQHILRAQSNDGIEAANAYLKEKNLEQLSI